jgi:hypothetical protein
MVKVDVTIKSDKHLGIEGVQLDEIELVPKPDSSHY